MAEFNAIFNIDDTAFSPDEGQETTTFKAEFKSTGTFNASFGTVTEVVNYTLYDETGYNTDGPMTQKAVTEALDETNERIDNIVSVDLSTKEDVANKVITISNESTNIQYPSAGAVYSALSQKVDVAIDDEETLVFKYN